VINWSDGGSKISRSFTVRHALWLPKWGRLAGEHDGLDDAIKGELVKFFLIMDQVQDSLGVKMFIHCAYRPREYNALVKGATKSAHLGFGAAACDFHVDLTGYLPGGPTCNHVRKLLRPQLIRFGLRMEDTPDSDWIHLDNKPGVNRYFKP